MTRATIVFLIEEPKRKLHSSPVLLGNMDCNKINNATYRRSA